MKNIICLPLLLLIFTAGFAQWEWQVPLPQGNSLLSVWPLDAQNVVAVGGYGTVLRTSDGGNSWQINHRIQGWSGALTSLHFIDSLRGWCVGANHLFSTTDGGYSWENHNLSAGFEAWSVIFTDANHGWIAGPGAVLRTTNGGISWDSTAIANEQFTSVYFVNNSTGWVASLQGYIYGTTDGGVSWNQLYANWMHSYQAIFFLDSLRGWAGGSKWQFGLSLVSTTDGGLTWTDHPSLPYGIGVSSIQFTDSLHGWMAAEGYEIYSTNDGGETWNASSQAFDRLLSVHVTEDGMNIWAAGGQGVMIASTDGGNNWASRTSHLAHFLQDVEFVNEQVGWAVGDTILKTTNGGASWIQQAMPAAAFLRSIFARDSLTAWCAGERVFQTTDGGQNWIEQNAPVNQTWWSVFFADENHGWLGGRFGALRKTTNGGATWDSLSSGTFADIGSVFFLDSLNGWIVGNSAKVWKTNDGGNTWASVGVPVFIPYMLWDVYFVSPQYGWIAGESTLLRTTNGGQSWENTTPPDPSIYRKVKFADEQYGWAAANAGVVYSTDGGVTWELQESPLVFATSVEFVDRNNGWLVGGGSILHTSNGGVTGIYESETSLAPIATFQLKQNYPNPFNPSTQIEFYLPEAERVYLQVYDILGRVVADLIDRRLAPGWHIITFDAGGRGSGLYFYRLKAGEFVETRKMVLLR